MKQVTRLSQSTVGREYIRFDWQSHTEKEEESESARVVSPTDRVGL